MKARIQYRAWQAVTAVVGRVPLRVAYGAAAALAHIAYYAWPRGRRATTRNYRRVLHGAPTREVERVARSSLTNYFRYLTDFTRFPHQPPERISAVVDGREAFAALDAALERGKGALVVCMHFGNWDLGAGAVAARGYPVNVVVETFEDDRLDAMVVRSRRRLGMEIVRMERLGPSLIRTLRRNELLALLIDRPVRGGGVKVRFFGEEVEVPAGPARLALLTGAQIIPAASVRLHPRKEHVRILAESRIDYTPTGNVAADIRNITQAIMDVHEKYIRRYPDQWYMFREMWPNGQPRGVLA